MRSPLKTHGGKSYLKWKIIKLFPKHYTYVEPFGGGASILLNKAPSIDEYYNDIHWLKSEVFRMIKSAPDEVVRQLLGITYSPESFHRLKDQETPIGYIVRSRMSRGGLGKEFAWSNRTRGGFPGDVNAWNTFIKEIPIISRRLRNVTILSEDGIQLCERFGVFEDTLLYVDPPYLNYSRTASDCYEHEMNDHQHKNLLDVLLKVNGKVILSSYNNFFYNSTLNNWRKIEFDMPNHSGQGKTKQRRIEVVYLNF